VRGTLPVPSVGRPNASRAISLKPPKAPMTR